MLDEVREAHYERYVEGWNDHDPEVVMSAFADGGTASDPATDGTISGTEIREWVEETVEAFPDVRFAVDRRAAEDGRLFVEWTMYGTHEGTFEGLPPTGEAVEISGVDVVEISEEGITTIDGYFNEAEFRAELGLTFPEVVGQLPTLAVGAVRNAL